MLLKKRCNNQRLINKKLKKKNKKLQPKKVVVFSIMLNKISLKS